MKLFITIDNLDDATFCLRAAKWLQEQPPTQRDAIIVYGEGDPENKFTVFVERVKSGISARQCY